MATAAGTRAAQTSGGQAHGEKASQEGRIARQSTARQKEKDQTRRRGAWQGQAQGHPQAEGKAHGKGEEKDRGKASTPGGKKSKACRFEEEECRPQARPALSLSAFGRGQPYE